MEVVLNVNDLQYQDLFQKLTLSLEKGKITTVSGSNNCGKTTLTRILDRKIVGDFNINCMGKDIKEYSLEDYNKVLQVVYPTRTQMSENTPLEEFQRAKISTEKIDFIYKKLKSLKFLDKSKEKLTDVEKIWTEILTSLGRCEEIFVLDGIDQFFGKKELETLYQFLRKWIKEFPVAILLTTTSLDQAIQSDFLYIIKDGEMILKGEPLTVLQKDNIINKAGLNVPFMIDLSVKLRDYDLIKDIELKKELLIDKLWN